MALVCLTEHNRYRVTLSHLPKFINPSLLMGELEILKSHLVMSEIAEMAAQEMLELGAADMPDDLKAKARGIFNA